MKAKDLAEILLLNPDMEVGISKFGGDNRWVANKIVVAKWDGSCDSIDLVNDPIEGGYFVEIIASEDQ